MTDVSQRRFRVSTTEPFGASGAHEMLLETPSQAVKFKWLNAMKHDISKLSGFSSNRAELIVEGPLLKLQPFGAVSKTRWFKVTTKKFSYLENIRHATEANARIKNISIKTTRERTLVVRISASNASLAL